MRYPAPAQSDPGVALGQLIIGAIEHLTTRNFCCPDCCPLCNALNFYYDELPIVADTGVAKAHNGSPYEWQMPEDGTINWPYLRSFWEVPASHTATCGVDPT